jgi:hypothetical protein
MTKHERNERQSPAVSLSLQEAHQCPLRALLAQPPMDRRTKRPDVAVRCRGAATCRIHRLVCTPPLCLSRLGAGPNRRHAIPILTTRLTCPRSPELAPGRRRLPPPPSTGTYATIGRFTLARCAWIASVTGRSRRWGSSIEKNTFFELDFRTSLPLNRWLSTRSMSDHGVEPLAPPIILQWTPSESTV